MIQALCAIYNTEMLMQLKRKPITMKKFNHPEEPTFAFEGAHPSHGYGGHAARSWGSYSTLTIYEVTALSFGMNPYTCETFWKDTTKYGTIQIGMWEDRITEITRAAYAGEIRLAIPTAEITKDTLVFTVDVEKYFDSKNEQISTQNTNLNQSERKKLLEIILGMAMHAYSYNPASNRNAATGSNKNSIYAGIQLVGLNASDDTIRKYLNEAADIFPEAKAIQSKS